MTLRGDTQGASVEFFHSFGRARRRRRGLAWIVVVGSVLVMAFAYGGTKWRIARNAMRAAAKAAAPRFVRVEDLPRAEFVRPEDLPRAAPVATRPLQEIGRASCRERV